MQIDQLKSMDQIVILPGEQSEREMEFYNVVVRGPEGNVFWTSYPGGNLEFEKTHRNELEADGCTIIAGGVSEEEATTIWRENLNPNLLIDSALRPYLDKGEILEGSEETALFAAIIRLKLGEFQLERFLDCNETGTTFLEEGET